VTPSERIYAKRESAKRFWLAAKPPRRWWKYWFVPVLLSIVFVVKLQVGYAAPAAAPKAITPALEASRTSGVAPLAVFFDATGTVASSTLRPFHELDYQWNFGDPTSGAWGNTGKSKNTATGPVTAHVYDTPGTYTITLAVRDAEASWATRSVTITVSDPNVVFSGTNTVCFSIVGDFAGCPSGATHVTTSNNPGNLAEITSHIATGKRLLLHRGERWTATNNYTIATDGPVVLGAYGPGTNPDARGVYANAPVIERTSGGSLFEFTASTTQRHEDWRIMDLYLKGVSDDTGSGAISGVTNWQKFLGYHLKIEGFSVPFGNSIWNLGHDQVFLVDSECFNGYVNQVYIGSTRLVLMGNYLHDSPTSHVLRVWQASKGVISHNIIRNAGPYRHALKLHGNPYQSCIPPNDGCSYPCNSPCNGVAPETREVVVADNLFSTSSQWAVTLGPQDSGADERLSDVIVERNQFLSAGSYLGVSLLVWARDVSVRNNLFDGTDANFGGYTAITVAQRGVEAAPERVAILNNTAYRGDSSAEFLFTSVEGLAQNTIVRNNLAAAPLATTKNMVSSVSTTTLQSNNLLASILPFVNAPARDFHLTATSSAIDQGMPVPVFDDFEQNSRPCGNGWDLGAFEYLPSLELRGTPADRTLHLNWTINTMLPVTSTWRIAYYSQTVPITNNNIVSPTRAYTLTGLTNYVWYTVTLNVMLDATPLYTDTIKLMPTDRLVYLPIAIKQ
jgi:hypothetical protein